MVLTGGLGDLGMDVLRLLATQATRILVVGRRPRDAAFEALGVASDLDVSRVTYVSIDLASSGAAGAIVGAPYVFVPHIWGTKTCEGRAK